MFDRKDAVPALFLLLLIFAIVVTLSQILVVHHHNHHSSRFPKYNKSVQAMLNHLEKTVQKVMRSNVLSQKKYENDLLARIYSARVREMLKMIERDILKKEQIRMIFESKQQYILNEDRKARVLQNSKRNQRNKYTDADIDISSYTNSDGKVYSRERKSRNNSSIFNHLRLTFDRKRIETDNVLRYNINEKSAQVYKSETNLKFGTAKSQSSGINGKGRKGYINRRKQKDICPEFPEELFGQLEVNVDESQPVGDITTQIQLGQGGAWMPRMCIARHRVAIVIPYRDRRFHLDTLLYHLLPILQRQQLDFRIFVVEQAGNETFNKGRLMNAGFMEAWKMDDFNCFIFHDVDLIPEDDRNMYSCPARAARHMSVAVDKFNYTLPYPRLVGGVFSIRREHFLNVNGYSNLYWGWGAEDDDMALRLKEVGLEISRPPAKVARYKMIKHDTRETLPFQWTYYMLRTLRRRYKKDGLNSLNYKVVSIDFKPTFTHVTINVGEAPRKRLFLLT